MLHTDFVLGAELSIQCTRATGTRYGYQCESQYLMGLESQHIRDVYKFYG